MLHSPIHLLHPLKVLWNERIILFWPIWACMTVAAVVLTWSFVRLGRQVPRPHHNADAPDTKESGRGANLPLLILAFSIVCYAALQLVWEDFTYYDDSHFTSETLQGRSPELAISPDVDRFWPMGYQEFNLVRSFTHSIYGYHALRIAQLLVLCALLLWLNNDLSLRARVTLIIALFVLPSFLVSFGGLIYPEPNEILWFTVVVFSTRQFELSRQIGWVVAAVISAQLLLYYKETASFLLLGFTVGRLFLRSWRPAEKSFNFEGLERAESRLDFCLMLLIVPFVLYYAAACFPFTQEDYALARRVSFWQAVSAYLALDLLAWSFLCTVVFRFVRYAQGKLNPSILWDGMALGGILCFLAYLLLRLESAYYLAPVDFIAILYLGRVIILERRNWATWGRVLAYGLASVVIIQSALLSSFRTYERKNVVHAKAILARAIIDRYDRDSEKTERLFFPFASPFEILEFASYLNYRGIPVEQSTNTGVNLGRVLLFGEKVQKNGPCGYRTFICHPGAAPSSGDLIVVFPDDSSSNAEMNAYERTGSEVLVAYAPQPLIPGWMKPEVSRLHIVSPVFAFSPLPDSWLSAAVVVSK